MGRAPCCEKMGLKKGPWTAEEDRILITFITHNGHGNWRALPKRAGLLRCGKSCRLRWMNYLRPDIKRGNFTREEEETIVKLHRELGNRWSVIASKLPGRTDNEIKNVWHTHLKKRLSKKSRPDPQARMCDTGSFSDSESNSPAPSSSEEVSSATTTTNTASAVCTTAESSENTLQKVEMDDSFWSEVLAGNDWSGASDLLSGSSDSNLLQFPESVGPCLGEDGDMDFWCNLFNRAEDFVKLPDFL